MTQFDPNHSSSQGEPETETLIIEDRSLAAGFVQLPKLVLCDRGLSRDAKLLYAILLSYAWQESRCFPGYRRLCLDMQASENMVRKYMRELEHIHLLSQRRRGLGKTNVYTLHDLRTAKIEVQEPQERKEPEHQKTAGKEESEEPKSDINLRISKGNAVEKRGDGKNRSAQWSAHGHQTISQSVARSRTASQQRSSSTFVPIGQSVVTRGASLLNPQTHLRTTSAAVTSPRSYEQLESCIREIGIELGDNQHLMSNLTQAKRLFDRLNMPEAAFVSRLYESRALTGDRLQTRGHGGLRSVTRPMAYFWTVARDQLGVETQRAEGTAEPDRTESPDKQGRHAGWGNSQREA